MALDLSTETARVHQRQYAIPERDLQAWLAQRNSAKERGIEFGFSLLAWRLWWMHELRMLGPEARRGRNRGNYRMCRVDEAGAFEAGNVYCTTVERNLAEPAVVVSRAERMREWHRTHPCHLVGKRGEDHPKSRAVMTPAGRFVSITAAAEAYGVTRQAMFYWVRGPSPEFQYADQGG